MEWHKQMARIARDLKHFKEHPEEIEDVAPHLAKAGGRR